MKRICFTGGSGKAGRHVISYLIGKGYKILNLDLVPFNHPEVDNLIVDVTNSGQVFNALCSYLNISELKDEKIKPNFDAVIHFAAIPRILIKTDEETFRVNVIGTYNLLEASIKLGIKKIIIASSETTYGICFAKGNPAPEYLPIDEKHPLNPMDSYGLSKVLNEETAKSFQLRSGVDIYALRIGNVIEPNEYYKFKDFFKNPEMRLRNLFNYIDARDLGQMVDLCINKNGLGFDVFNIANELNSVNISNEEIIKRFYPQVKIKREIKDFEALYSSQKAKKLLGFHEKHSWKMYMNK